jgi:hypothetical protein
MKERDVQRRIDLGQHAEKTRRAAPFVLRRPSQRIQEGAVRQ